MRRLGRLSSGFGSALAAGFAALVCFSACGDSAGDSGANDAGSAGAGGSSGSGASSGSSGDAGASTGGSSGAAGSDAGNGGESGSSGQGGDSGGTSGAGGGGRGGAGNGGAGNAGGGRGGAGNGGNAGAGGTGGLEFRACPIPSAALNRFRALRIDHASGTCTAVVFQNAPGGCMLGLVSGGWCLATAIVSTDVEACLTSQTISDPVVGSAATGTFSVNTGANPPLVDMDVELTFPPSAGLPATVSFETTGCAIDCMQNDCRN